MRLARFLPSLLGAAALLCTAAGAAVQPAAGESRITQVKVYPGSATVERVARVAGGSRQLTFSCLPAGLDVQSLQVSADAAVRIGETSVLNGPRALSAGCATSALDGRIRELEDQKAALEAERGALGLVTGYLKGLSGGAAVEGDGAGRRAAPVDARHIAAVTDALRRTGQDALQKQHLITRRQGDLDRLLAPLLAERDRTQGNEGAEVVTVSVTLDTARDAEVRLSYQVAGPGWTPAYRALLDTGTRRLRIERQALVAQSTGEDWRGVKLTLSTGQPRRGTTGQTPAPWRIGVEPPPRADDGLRMREMAAPVAAMARAPEPKGMADKLAGAPLFDVSVFNNSFATEFAVPQAIDVPSSGQRVSMALGQHEDSGKLLVRTSPRVEAAAFLVAEMDQPAGVWPAGPLQLYRDGAFVGHGQWNAPADARVTLSFGRDELVRVQADPEQNNQGSGGFAGSRAERRVQRAYVVENRHRTPVTLQVIEATPVSVDEQVRVATRFSPQPSELAWNRQPGLAMWTLELDAGKTTRMNAEYTLDYPKDARLQVR